MMHNNLLCAIIQAGGFAMKKHAYLIIAHTNFEQLQKLVNTLDDERNDIYIHVDKKSQNFEASLIKTCYSQVNIVKRTSVNWGGYSQINCELLLLKSAIFSNREYSRYHLISGMDLPIKSQDYIHDFFENNNNEYIRYDFRSIDLYSDRSKYYYLFQEIVGRNKGIKVEILSRLQDGMLILQKKLNFSRKQYLQLYKGTNWFSITDNLAKYVVEKEKLIRKQFKYSFCADELFLQTVAKESPFRDNIIDDSLRLIDWKRGNPYIYRKNDFKEIVNSAKIFARKFDENVDQDIINMVINHIS